MDVQQVYQSAVALLDRAAVEVQRIPGSAIVWRYVRSSYQDDPVRSAIELFLFLFAVRYLLAPAYSTQKGKGFVEFTNNEIDSLVDDWAPEPLVAPSTEFEVADVEKRPIIVGPAGPKVKLSSGKTVSNLATLNFYNFASNEALKEKAIKTLRTYGVGPCGPRGFYGTQDVHMQTEMDIATHLGTAACIMYSQAFSTVSSVIPAFSKRGDFIVADESVSYPVRKGIQISRSTVRWYKHNDMADLERVLAKLVKEQARKPLTRRFIVTEGIFEHTGDIADLPKLIELKLRYKFRLILDESYSYGVLGRTGRGITEEQNVDPQLVDMIVGSLAGPLAAGGGFCAGNEEVVEHQRISSAAYTFSAALPALLSTTASETIRLLQDTPETTIKALRENIKVMKAQLDLRSEWMRCTSHELNPMLVVILKEDVVASQGLSNMDQEIILQDIVDECLANGVLITRLKAMPPLLGVGPKDQGWQAHPALKICVTTGLSKKETEKAGTTIRHAVTKVMSKRGKT